MRFQREDMTASEWHDETGRKVNATFVGWGVSASGAGSASGIVARLAASLFGPAPGVEIRNVVRSIEPCTVCGGVVYVSADGAMLIAGNDAEQSAARGLVASAGVEWNVLGHAEFWVQRTAQEYFIAPTLILHYIAKHGYVPPDEFVATVLMHLTPRAHASP